MVAIFATNFWLLFVSMLLMGLSNALNSGTVDAWSTEKIIDRGNKARLQSYIGVFQSSMASGMVLGAIVGGLRCSPNLRQILH